MDIRAPGEKVNYQEESLYGHIKPTDIGSRVKDAYEQASSYSTSSKRRVSTAHIQPGFDIHGNLAYDQFVSTCSQFLGSSTINDTVTHFAENVLAILSSPTTLDMAEVKRRMEQILPPDKTYTHHRGSHMTDEDCTLLCSQADRIVNNNNASKPNLNIVDDHPYRPEKETGSVHYIRHLQGNRHISFPEHLPSFVEPNTELESKVVYDMDITPYDSEVDDEPINTIPPPLMKAFFLK